MLLSASIVKCFMFIVLCRLSFAVVTIHHSGQEEQQGKSSNIIRGSMKRGNNATGGLRSFFKGRQNGDSAVGVYAEHWGARLDLAGPDASPNVRRCGRIGSGNPSGPLTARVEYDLRIQRTRGLLERWARLRHPSPHRHGAMVPASSPAAGRQVGVGIRTERGTEQRKAEEREQQDGGKTPHRIIVAHPGRRREGRPTLGVQTLSSAPTRSALSFRGGI